MSAFVIACPLQATLTIRTPAIARNLDQILSLASLSRSGYLIATDILDLNAA
jgi:hypothetical protein